MQTITTEPVVGETAGTDEAPAYVRFLALTDRSQQLEEEQRQLYRMRVEALADLIIQEGIANGSRLATRLECAPGTAYPLFNAARKVLHARANGKP